MSRSIDLLENPELLAGVFSLVPGFITLQGVDANFIIANEASMSAMGFSSLEQMSGRYPGDIRSKFSEIHEQIVANNYFIVENKAIVTTVTSAFIANGNWGLYFGQQKPFFDQNGQIIGVASHTIDITKTSLAISIAPLFLAKQSQTGYGITQGIYRYTSCYEKWNLSKRQSECFFWLLQRKTAPEIGQILGLSKRTVEAYIRDIKEKLQVSTLNELLEFAYATELEYYIPKHWLGL